ncbi:MAG: bifunctional glycosyltransferase family 2/GtrA family protein [Lentisphaeria bacterium]|nr:bifunctional glycosyltransferase family 2/GtrA family protein [Lentisphaeria bacterium]
MQTDKKIAIVLPAFDPDDKMLTFVNNLHNSMGDSLELLVINDGSKAEKIAEYFDVVSKIPGCTVLHHEKNRGKGAALKTAFNYLLKKYADDDSFVGCVTADCDGQHSLADVRKCMEILADNPDKLILGCREFQKDNVPWKSRFGNELTLFIFNKILKISLDDTQTGLRGLGRNVMAYSLGIKGDRFEFETDMLLISKIKKFGIISYPIETIYFDENSGTHFRPLKDGLKIYWRILRVLFGQFLAFCLSSLSAAILDIGIFFVLFHYLFKEDLHCQIPGDRVINLRVFYCCFIARVISSVWNFYLNRRLVFKSHGKGHIALGKEVVKYYLLAVVVFAVSWIFTDIMDDIVHEKFLTVVKAIIDTVIFVIIYYIQKLFIFKKRK